MDETIKELARVAVSLLDAPERSSPVVRHAAPDELISRFSKVLPLAVDGDVASTEELVAAMELVAAHSMRTAHPRFMNQNFAGPDPIAVVGDWIGAALNTIASTFEMAPVFTMMERALIRRLGELAGFGDGDGVPGMFCAGGSIGTVHALQLARHRRWPDGVTTGFAEPVAVFVSETAHYSTGKAAALLGLGTDAVHEVAVDDRGAMDVDDLRRRVLAAKSAGRTPLAVVATSGTTVMASFDPIDDLADVCAEHDMWLHVDGCFGGSALFSEKERHRLRGSERADSMVWNLHKMMGMTQQCTALLVRRPEQLRACFSVGADYIFQDDKLHADMDIGDDTFVCARRVDVLKLWLAWKARGDDGFARRVEHAVELADHTRAAVADADDLWLVGAGDFTTVCVAWMPAEWHGTDPVDLDHVQRSELHRVPPEAKALMQRDGSAMIGYQPVGGLNCFRIIFTNPEVTAGDADDILEIIRDASARAWNARRGDGDEGQMNDDGRRVTEDAGLRRFELRRGDEVLSFADYRQEGTTIIVPHVETDPRHRGQGNAAVLMDGLLELIRSDGRTIVPLCPFAAAHIRDDPRHHDLVAES